MVAITRRLGWGWGVCLMVGLGAAPGVAAPITPAPALCQTPALERVQRHRIAAGETLQSIAQTYNLIPATLMGFNPVLRGGQVPVGTVILIPPYNGIRVQRQAHETWAELAQKYGVRADVLFEVNGCQMSPQEVFIPGVNWSPIATQPIPTPQTRRVIGRPPLATTPLTTLLRYGWRLDSATQQTVFHSGVDLAAPLGTPVLAVGDGTVAFAGVRDSYGNLIVINHANGLQTRYAQLGQLLVKTGQKVRQGQAIGTVGASGQPSSTAPHLHYEVRRQSAVGWVAQDPQRYLPTAAAK